MIFAKIAFFNGQHFLGSFLVEYKGQVRTKAQYDVIRRQRRVNLPRDTREYVLHVQTKFGWMMWVELNNTQNDSFQGVSEYPGEIHHPSPPPPMRNRDPARFPMVSHIAATHKILGGMVYYIIMLGKY